MQSHLQAEVVKNGKAVKGKVDRCPKCKRDHPMVNFTPLKMWVPGWTHDGKCPNTGSTLYLNRQSGQVG